MVEAKRSINVKIPEDLHAKVKAEQAAQEHTMSQYIEQVLEEHFRRGSETTNASELSDIKAGKTWVVRVIRHYQAAHPDLIAKTFLLDLAETALEMFAKAESKASGVSCSEAQEPVDQPDTSTAEKSPDERKSTDGAYTGTEDGEKDSPEDENSEAKQPDSGGSK